MRPLYHHLELLQLYETENRAGLPPVELLRKGAEYLHGLKE